MKLLTTLLAAAALATLAPVATALAAGGTGADLQVSGAASTGSPLAGAPFAYTFQVKNAGPDNASSSTFADALPAGTVYNYATVNGLSSACAVANGVGGQVVSCTLGTIAKGGQATVVVNVNAPVTAGTFSNTGMATSSVPDPQPANNAVAVTVQAKSAACALPAGQTTLNGLVMAKYTDSSGLFQNFAFQANGVTYTVLTNFYDGSAPLTEVINLACQQSPVQFVGVGSFVNVTGTVGSAPLFGSSVESPVIYASFVQVLTLKDKI